MNHPEFLLKIAHQDSDNIKIEEKVIKNSDLLDGLQTFEAQIKCVQKRF